MPLANYLKIKIGNQFIIVDSASELPVSINYAIEDSDDSQEKKSGESFQIQIPANLENDKISNTFRNPSVEDLTSGEVFKSAQDAYIECNGQIILAGQAFLKFATHSNIPLSYTYNISGDNADFLILLSESTLYDFVKQLNFTFEDDEIIASWQFDGTDESLPYVFAPVRYRAPFGGYKTENAIQVANDDDLISDYLRPSISKYWILYWGFKSIGYKIKSNFFDSEYFRRQVMPWTFGSFLDSGGTKLDAHKFLAKSVEDKHFDIDRGKDFDQFVDLDVSNDSTVGAFDNNGDYIYNVGEKAMEWHYNSPDFGPLNAAFSSVVFYDGSLSGKDSNLYAQFAWFINGVEYQRDNIVVEQSGILGTKRPSGQTEVFFKTGDYGVLVNEGDVVSGKVFLHMYRDKNAINDVTHISLTVLQFQLDYFRINIGGIIDFTNYTAFKDYNFLEFFAGIVDEFDLSYYTDVISKIIYIEPTHSYSTTANINDKIEGFFKEDFINWNGKEDLSKNWKIENYSNIKREKYYKYKEDSNDGILKLIQDRNSTILAQAKYILPSRFLPGKDTHENRFFAATMNYSVTQWKGLGTGDNLDISPQMVCIIPENISNTSQSESENTFKPKSCYYKGLITGAGAWRFNGEVKQEYPFMFSVNYQSGGENDPILSYSDENINGVIGIGLFRRFFWQRAAILRNGIRYNGAFFKLNNNDISRSHREFKSYRGQKWELIQIKGYKPLTEDSTEVLMYKWSPIVQKDFENTFPSVNSINGSSDLVVNDFKYSNLMCLYSDIPT